MCPVLGLLVHCVSIMWSFAHDFRRMPVMVCDRYPFLLPASGSCPTFCVDLDKAESRVLELIRKHQERDDLHQTKVALFTPVFTELVCLRFGDRSTKSHWFSQVLQRTNTYKYIISATLSHFHFDFSFPLRILLSCPAMPWPWTVVAGYPWHRWRHWHGDWFLLALWDGWIHCALDGTFTGFCGELKFNLQGNLLSILKAHEKQFVNWGEELVSALSAMQKFRITPRYPMFFCSNMVEVLLLMCPSWRDCEMCASWLPKILPRVKGS